MENCHFKIKNLKARPVLVPFRYKPTTASATINDAAMVLIDLETTEGIVGRSYLFVYSKIMLKPTVACLEGINELLSGQPVVPIEIDRYLRQCFKMHNTGGILGQALSGIDMACWDAYTQYLNQPLSRALGGQTKPIQAYNSCGLFIQDPETIAEEACELISEGNFNAIKVRVGRPNIRDDIRAIQNIKDGVGENITLMCDFNQSLSVNEAIARCRALDYEGLYWIEDPIRHDDYEGCAKVSAEISTPLQVGENLINTYEMQKAINVMAGDYFMPDVQRIGGVTGWLQASALAHVNDIDISSHLFPEISCHLLAVTPTCHWLEFMDWATPILKYPVQIKDGYALTPDRAGTGVEWNETAVQKFLVL